jgi:hypothetical protein
MNSRRAVATRGPHEPHMTQRGLASAVFEHDTDDSRQVYLQKFRTAKSCFR